jgi:hypothetical protein
MKPVLRDLVAQVSDLQNLYSDANRFGEPLAEGEMIVYIGSFQRNRIPSQQHMLTWLGSKTRRLNYFL